ncbi:Crp/Fnr family transcriptional regulator [bacterium]|nr:Crp/Fnr family transcriptional regulator [Chloroflexi bacterium CFX6]RIL09897.1 MAG: Crp/Fnr family transcriptional regulator [bacterium]
MASDLTALLRPIDLFRGLDDDVLGATMAASRRVACQAGGFLFHQGETAATFYILVHGRVRLSHVTAEGHQVVMRFFNPGDAIGIVAVLAQARYPASAEVIEAADTLAWDGAAFNALMERFPALSYNGLKLVAHRMGEYQDRVRELATERVERRIARALLRLVSQSGRRTDAGIVIDIPLSRQDLAEMTGTTVYTVSRTLAAWEEHGIVRSARKRVTVADPHRLVVIAEDLPGASGASPDA